MSATRAAIAGFISLVALTGHLLATTVQVGACRIGLRSFATIQSAVNASLAGNRILVCPGTDPEQVVIDKALTLKGVPSGTSGASVIVPPTGGVVQNTTSLSDVYTLMLSFRYQFN